MCFRYKRFCDYCWQLVWVCVFAVCWKHRHSLRSDSSCLTQPHQDRSRNIKMIGKIDWIVKSPFIVYLPFSPLEWRHAITVETEDVHQPLHFAFSYIMDIMDPDIERLIHQVLCHLSWSWDLFLLIICRSKARSWDLHYLHQHQLHDGLQDQVGPWYSSGQVRTPQLHPCSSSRSRLACANWPAQCSTRWLSSRPSPHCTGHGCSRRWSGGETVRGRSSQSLCSNKSCFCSVSSRETPGKSCKHPPSP